MGVGGRPLPSQLHQRRPGGRRQDRRTGHRRQEEDQEAVCQAPRSTQALISEARQRVQDTAPVDGGAPRRHRGGPQRGSDQAGGQDARGRGALACGGSQRLPPAAPPSGPAQEGRPQGHGILGHRPGELQAQTQEEVGCDAAERDDAHRHGGHPRQCPQGQRHSAAAEPQDLQRGVRMVAGGPSGPRGTHQAGPQTGRGHRRSCA
mmetsp:Transcript_8200/g.20128  ORF Transcript_8200/g.20128 Transcript_8200/m.20128 type:complete len:205 (-) Transcript_8200:780-1394(-)